ncbi:MAG: sigma-70 family RNA polymerase sigma factor [Actinobacteria bacterium]|nr:sigma-70 family RNA polymerase sigma factor [Actinomycetota bacterium]
MREADEATAPLQRFEVLYRDCYQAIYAYVWRRLTGGLDDVPDLVAEVFAIAWRRMDAMPEPPGDRMWLYGVARRVVADHQRRTARRSRLEYWLRAKAYAERDGQVRDPAQQRLRAAVERLPPLDRETLRLVAWDGLSHAETAEVLGCSVNAVALRVHKAKARLKAELGPPEPLLPSPSACASTDF